MILSVLPTGELEVSPSGVIITAPGLRPGGEERARTGSMKVRNISPKTLDVQVHAVPSRHDLDALLWVEVDRSDQQLFRGTLGQLAQWTDRSIALAPGEATKLSVRTWLPVDVDSGYEGRVQTIELEFNSVVGESNP